ncbi:hypothetical protein PUG42_18765 [Erwiniaceae bacterium L1_54_3]|nr:hypothetical protein [Erwiniaceae bacterium L1_54_3]
MRDFSLSQNYPDAHIKNKNIAQDNSDPLFKIKIAMLYLQVDLIASDQYENLTWINKELRKLSDIDFSELTSWNDGSYESIFKNIRNGLGENKFTIDLVNLFRWGNRLVKRNVDLAEYLINKYYPYVSICHDILATPQNVLYAHVNVLSYRWMNGDLEYGKICARRATKILDVLKLDDSYLRNRSNYYLSSIYNLSGDVELSLEHYFRAVTDEHCLDFQKWQIFSIVYADIQNRRMPKLVENMVFKNENHLNPMFWIYFSELCSADELLERRLKLVACVLLKLGHKTYDFTGFGVSHEKIIKSLSFSFSNDDKLCISEQLNEIESIINLDVDGSKYHPSYHLRALNLKHKFDETSLLSRFYNCSVILSKIDDHNIILMMEDLFFELDNEAVSKTINNLKLNDGCYYSEHEKRPIWIKRDIESEMVFLNNFLLNASNEKSKQLAIARLVFLYIRGESYYGSSVKVQSFKLATRAMEALDKNSFSKYISFITDFGFYRQQEKYILGCEEGEYIFFESNDSDKLIIAFSDRYSYHVFPSVPSFSKEHSCNVLFINNPKCNWYSDDEDVRVEGLINKLVLGKYLNENVMCYHASMGGYAAIKFGLRHNFNILAVNPQFNLDLWAQLRREDQSRINNISEKINLDKLSVGALEGQTLSLIIGRHPADALAFQAFIENLRDVKFINLYIEKHRINEHEGLIMKAYGSNFVEVVQERFKLMGEFRKDASKDNYLKIENKEELIYNLKNKTKLKNIIIVRNGVWYLDEVE